MKRVLALLLAVILLVGITACGEEKGDDFTGKYTMYAMETDGKIINYAEYLKFFADLAEELGTDSEAEPTPYMEIKADGTAVMFFDEETTLTWKAEGNVVTFAAEGEELPVTIENGAFKMDLGGEMMYFAKEGCEVALEYADINEILG